VHEGNEVFVEGGIRIMHKPKSKASASSARDLLHCLSTLSNPVMQKKCIKYLE